MRKDNPRPRRKDRKRAKSARTKLAVIRRNTVLARRLAAQARGQE